MKLRRRLGALALSGALAVGVLASGVGVAGALPPQDHDADCQYAISTMVWFWTGAWFEDNFFVRQDLLLAAYDWQERATRECGVFVPLPHLPNNP